MTGIGVNLIGGGSPVCDEAAGSVSHDGRHLSVIVPKIPAALESWIQQQSKKIHVSSLSSPFAAREEITQKIKKFVEEKTCDRNKKYGELAERVTELKICVKFHQVTKGSCQFLGTLGTEGSPGFIAYLTTTRNFNPTSQNFDPLGNLEKAVGK